MDDVVSVLSLDGERGLVGVVGVRFGKSDVVEGSAGSGRKRKRQRHRALEL